MAAVITRFAEFFADELTTNGVMHPTSQLGRDYIILRRKTQSNDCKIGLLVKFESDDVTEVGLAASNGAVDGIIPDTMHNRQTLETDNSGAQWTYALAFATGSEIDIAVFINNCICRVVVAASQACTPDDDLESAGSGQVGLQAASGIAIGKPFFITTAGTGNPVGYALLYAARTHALHA